MQKKVKFIKNHVNGIKKGDVETYDEGRADYLVRIKAAEYVAEEPKNKAKQETKETKTKSTTKKAAAKKDDKSKDAPCSSC